MFAQTYQPIEVLVADDASTDATRSILDGATSGCVRRFHNDRRLGYLRTTNRLFAVARGEFVAFQDADDLSDPMRLELQVRALRADPRLGLCGTWARLVDAAGRMLGVDKRPSEPDEIRAVMYTRNPFCGATIVVRRAVLEEIGGYREEFEGFSHQDYDWACRLLEAYPGRNIPSPLYSYRQHRMSNSKQVNVGRAIGDELVRALAEQRRAAGTDVIAAGDARGFAALVKEISRPYREDPALLDRVFASRFLWAGFSGWAVRRAVVAVGKRPFDFRNHRTLEYCLRQAILRALRRAGRRGGVTN
jgi:glycosyltransferase involved in cell wall biosynthesis